MERSHLTSRCTPPPTIGARIEHWKFDVAQLDKMKEFRQNHRFSTLNHSLGFCYNDTRVIKWVMKQAGRGFQVSGSFA